MQHTLQKDLKVLEYEARCMKFITDALFGEKAEKCYHHESKIEKGYVVCADCDHLIECECGEYATSYFMLPTCDECHYLHYKV